MTTKCGYLNYIILCMYKIICIREREQLLSPVHREDEVEGLVKEIYIAALNQSSVQLETDHQRVKRHSQLADAEASAKAKVTEMVRTPHSSTSSLVTVKPL